MNLNRQKMLKYVLLTVFVVFIGLGVAEFHDDASEKNKETHEKSLQTVITGFVKSGESLFNIFKKHNLRIAECLMVSEASADIHKLSDLNTSRPYKIVVGADKQIESFTYWIDDDSILTISNTASGFTAEKIPVYYENRVLHMAGVIRDNLISSVGEDRENLMLALELSDVFAWDIDFATDLRNGDTFKIVVEGLYLDNEFKKYGKVLSAEFINDGDRYRAYRFDHNGDSDYYNEKGVSLRRAFLKAPLNFRRISSGYSRSRLHPILKINRAHHGIDYAAPLRTPVSAIGDGTVIFAGYKGGYGKLLGIRHRNGFKTFYGHLSGFGKGIRNGVKVTQGQLIGYVGTTGQSTGPHLHYEMRINNKPVNPFRVKLPAGEAIPKKAMADFTDFRNKMDTQLASMALPVLASAEKKVSSMKYQ